MRPRTDDATGATAVRWAPDIGADASGAATAAAEAGTPIGMAVDSFTAYQTIPTANTNKRESKVRCMAVGWDSARPRLGEVLRRSSSRPRSTADSRVSTVVWRLRRTNSYPLRAAQWRKLTAGRRAARVVALSLLGATALGGVASR